MKYLEILDISNNKLTTISKSIFGISDISANMRIYADGNNWHCDCQLQRDMNSIFNYQSSKYLMLCETPEQYKGCLVFDERICNGMDEEITGQSRTTTTRLTTTTIKSVAISTVKSTIRYPTDQPIFIPTISTAGTVSPSQIVPLECAAPSNSLIKNATRQNCRWPQIYFFPKLLGR